MRRVITMAVLAAACSMWPCAVAARGPAPPPDVLMIGSSSMGGALGWVMERRLEDEGLVVWRKHRTSAGLCRPDFYDWHERVPELPISAGTRAVLVYLGGNDGQGLWLRPEERQRAPGARRASKWVRFDSPMWAPKYGERVTALIDALCEQGARQVLWLSVVDASSERWEEKYAQVRTAQRAGVARSRCGVYVDTTGDGPALQSRAQRRKGRLRARDGVHATRLGARTIWQRVGEAILAELDLPPRESDEEREPRVAAP